MNALNDVARIQFDHSVPCSDWIKSKLKSLFIKIGQHWLLLSYFICQNAILSRLKRFVNPGNSCGFWAFSTSGRMGESNKQQLTHAYVRAQRKLFREKLKIFWMVPNAPNKLARHSGIYRNLKRTVHLMKYGNLSPNKYTRYPKSQPRIADLNYMKTEK